jgi:N-acyl-D-aspartate/D-glutamate deacylase
VVALMIPPSEGGGQVNFATGFALNRLPGWSETMSLPIPERMKALSDPETRRRLDRLARSAEPGPLTALAQWENLTIKTVYSAAYKALEGRTVGEVAVERGVDPFDVVCDVVLADDLRTQLTQPSRGPTDDDWKASASVWQDPRTIIGGSDAGAHMDMMCGAVLPTSWLAHGVRERGLISLEDAVHELTDVPARLYGLKDRGRIAEGWAADLVLFDEDTIAPGPLHVRDDLPGGAVRMYAEATGVVEVMVNGVTVAANGAFSGNTPGRVLRSGTDTVTVKAGDLVRAAK